MGSTARPIRLGSSSGLSAVCTWTYVQFSPQLITIPAP